MEINILRFKVYDTLQYFLPQRNGNITTEDLDRMFPFDTCLFEV